ncbi:MAG TPA: N-acetyl-gamma-glutamyl-phosphate reductase [Bryobacterales bacterium]|jgi:N-acetyl-gamma-glutamyl-phosphate reductase|nr:N-acetyl-gamma-glutamyl-phosphate reductase [Bryobacterales bacterium]
MQPPSKIRAGIIGHTGYSGGELVKILQRHPRVEPVLLEHRRNAGERGSADGLIPAPIPWQAEASADGGISVLFLATPPEVSLELAPPALERGLPVIDLSGAFRLRTPENYRRWYGAEHPRPDLLAEAAYGLPEFCRERIRGARLVANPGCYPTAANLALKPLIEADVIDRTAGVICDAKSGVSGAGKKPTAKTHFCEVAENFSAYSILEHRHVPEVLLTSGLAQSEFSFTAQLLPLHRGILETIYFRSKEPLDSQSIAAIYQGRYRNEPFVRIYSDGAVPDLHAVAHSNFCDLGIRSDPASRRVVVISAIDNLVKGAAGQAVQNMNLLLGFDEVDGLQ